ncbi:hypothetical protein MLD38_018447 [Melastoma candidum]|uniref:Uncharacterized protein n=1 Tax=Melastoma candidum TaxID=119954 RepID=A0ACB9QT99_9MYRT|nr:hypothetical protein MLD38_018447 [Melastoma candidum]
MSESPSSAATLPLATNPDVAPAATRKYARPNFGFFFPFDLPLTAEALAVRIRKNLAHFALFYMQAWSVGLSIILVPEWTAFLNMTMMLFLTGSLQTLLGLKPKIMFIHGATVMALVLFFLGVVSTITPILTEAGIQLLPTLAIWIQVVLVHAILWRDDLNSVSSYSIVEEASTGELAVPPGGRGVTCW